VILSVSPPPSPKQSTVIRILANESEPVVYVNEPELPTSITEDVDPGVPVPDINSAVTKQELAFVTEKVTG
jgi:hypothetical protein